MKMQLLAQALGISRTSGDIAQVLLKILKFLKFLPHTTEGLVIRNETPNSRLWRYSNSMAYLRRNRAYYHQWRATHRFDCCNEYELGKIGKIGKASSRRNEICDLADSQQQTDEQSQVHDVES